MKKRNQGFTLVEIMIVVAIIGILAAVAVPSYLTYRKTSQATTCCENLAKIHGAVQTYMNLHQNAVPTMTQLCGTEEGKLIQQTPSCAAGGTYTIADGGNDVTCSIGQNGSEDKSLWHVMNKDTATP